MQPQPPHNPGPSSPPGSDRWPEDPADKSHPASDAFSHLHSHFDELLAYINHYLTARIDSVKVMVRSAVLWTALGIIALIAVAAVLVTACVMLLAGLAQAIDAAAHTGPWLGNLVVAVVVLSAIVLTIRMGVKRFTATMRQQLVQHYERRTQQQRGDFGHDVNERAEQAQRRQ